MFRVNSVSEAISRSMMFIGYFILILALFSLIFGNYSLGSGELLLLILSILISVGMIIASIYLAKRNK